MSLRGYPERIYAAQRVAVVHRLVSLARVPREDADEWVSQWESQAHVAGIRRASRAYWDTGFRWIAAQRSRGPLAE